MKTAVCRDTATFRQAFAASKLLDCDEFTWRGNRYHTRTAEEEYRQEQTEPVVCSTKDG